MRPIDADVLINEWNEKAAKMSRDRDGAIPVDFSLVISAVSKAPTLTLDDLRPKGRAMWIPYYNGGLDRREYRCSRCWNGTPNNQDTRCLNCGSEMLREL
jgi:hypothetical protein